jgi:hypothetical protein
MFVPWISVMHLLIVYAAVWWIMKKHTQARRMRATQHTTDTEVYHAQTRYAPNPP